ncbi:MULTISPECIES: ThuA domain-containing protein [unclassified Leifsonia]|uniref:ThuA domain-containing protein n=1 Tax=unclassified Leifsonia TaxID=2663824 RepID=UPI0008A76F93|nr:MULTISPECIES: ThuA domain-containing protein [unclassified Leifsonia]SEH55033.1 hypothetical protein SAMN04515694_10127 [Leifsonia sp. CL154]SFL24034.1 hypothetical protein SAMN04515692_101452 [Leifsonia sp. CL147]
MTRALILSGEGRYADPWHPFARTSDRLAGLLTSLGMDAEVSGDVDARMAALPSELPDLLVLNLGDPALNFPDDPAPDAEAEGRAGLLGYLAAGRPLLGVHATSTSLRGIPEWKSILGGVWVRGESFHPDYARLNVHLAAEPPAFIAGLDDFAVQDELYSNLSLEPDNIVLATASATASSGGDEVPVVWARTVGPASARVVYDALGHDTAAYESAGHQALLARCVRWLLSSAD